MHFHKCDITMIAKVGDRKSRQESWFEPGVREPPCVNMHLNELSKELKSSIKI